MTDKKTELRTQAEEKASQSPEDLGTLSPAETRQTLHELRVHQIELEIQNEELRQSQAELDAARSRYFDLYDLAPVGYCTVSEKGLILEANLTAATLLGETRSALVQQPLSRFILNEDEDIFYLYLKQLLDIGSASSPQPRSWQAGQAGAVQACELRMLRQDNGTTFWAHLETAVQHPATAEAQAGTPELSIVLNDITLRKQAERSVQERFKELNCLYGLSAIVELPDISLDEILTRAVLLLPPAWQFPEIAEACIVMREKTFQTARFRETSWMLIREIIVNGKPIGQVKVCYLEAKQTRDEGLFQKEERKLLTAVAERLGRITERIFAEEALQRAYDELEQRVAARTEELQHTLTELQGSEERYRILFSAAGDGILILSETGQIAEVNESFARMHGYSVQEMLHINLNDLATPESFQMFPNPLRLLQAGEALTFEVDHYHKDGHIIPLEVSTTLIASGGKLQFQCFHRDITGRRQAEKSLLLTRMSVESASDALFWMKPDGSIVNVNEAACRLLGYTREELLQLSVPDVDVNYNAEVWIHHFAELKKYGTLKFESDQRAKDGRIIPVEIVANYMQFENDVFNCAFVRDITQRKLAEGELATKSQQLEQTNTALHVLLSHREEELRETEQKMVANLRKLVIPYVGELRKLHLNPGQSNYLDIIDGNLQQVISPFMQNLAARYTTFTPREIQIANLIVEGKTSKEIADIINAGKDAIDFHRNNIRKKLGLSGTETNLRTFLLTLSKK